MVNSIPGVVLPGDAEYKNQMITLPTSMLYGPHQSRLFWLKIMGRKFTIEDAEAMVKAANGTITLDYVTPAYLEKQGITGLVLPVVEANVPDERRTIFQWEEAQIDDNDAINGTFTEPMATLNAGTEYTFTVTSTTALAAGKVIRTNRNTQIRVSSILTATTFKGYVVQNSYTPSSSFPGTDTAANGTAIQDNDTYIVLASAQKVGGTPISLTYNRPTIRRNAFQTIAVQMEKTGHATAEDGTHATMTTSLAERAFQTWYKTYCAIDDTLWFGKFGHGVYGSEEVYACDGIKSGIGTTKTISDYSSGTTLNIDVIDAIMTDVTQTNNPKNLAVFGDSYIGQAINKIGRENTEIRVEPGSTEFGSSFLKVHTHRGAFKFFEMPESKLFGDTADEHTLRVLNLDLIKPVTRAGRTFKVDKDRSKDQTQDATYDVLRGDISLMMCHKAQHFEISGIEG